MGLGDPRFLGSLSCLPCGRKASGPRVWLPSLGSGHHGPLTTCCPPVRDKDGHRALKETSGLQQVLGKRRTAVLGRWHSPDLDRSPRLWRKHLDPWVQPRPAGGAVRRCELRFQQPCPHVPLCPIPRPPGGFTGAQACMRRPYIPQGSRWFQGALLRTALCPSGTHPSLSCASCLGPHTP